MVSPFCVECSDADTEVTRPGDFNLRDGSRAVAAILEALPGGPVSDPGEALVLDVERFLGVYQFPGCEV